MLARPTTVDWEEAKQALERVLDSRVFARAERSRRFLSYLVESALKQPPDFVKEYTIALDVFDRDKTYDPSVDATVRVEASRLRARLREYYTGEGQDANVIIDIPKGHYAAEFSHKALNAPAPDPMLLDQIANALPTPETSALRSSPDGWTGHILAVSGRRSLLVALPVLLCVAGVIGLEVSHRRDLYAGSSIHSMAVLPLRNLSGSADQDYLAEGMTDEVNNELARIPHLRVISHDSVMNVQLHGKGLRQVGQELHVDTVVEGSIFSYGGKVRINAQLTEVSSDRQLWAASTEGDAKDLFRLQDSVAREIASHASLEVLRGPQTQEIAGKHPSPEAYDAYLRGRYFLDKRDPTLSTTYFQRAIDLDSTYASAYAGLAEALEAALTLGSARYQETLSRALQSAHKAIELDPQNGPAYSALGTIEFTQLWNWPHAEQDLLKGMQLSPGDSFPLVMYGLLLDATHRPDEAIEQMRQATVMDPLSFYVSRSLGSALYYAKRYDEALQQLNRAKELQPDKSYLVDNWISWTYEMKGMRREAVQYDLSRLQGSLSANHIASLRSTYQAGGWNAYWRLRLQDEADDPVQECAPYERAVDYLRLGEPNPAIFQLQQAFDQRCFWMGTIDANPRFDQIRTDPRFATLARRVNGGVPEDDWYFRFPV